MDSNCTSIVERAALALPPDRRAGISVLRAAAARDPQTTSRPTGRSSLRAVSR
jgi:hypothetical protein